MYLRRLFLSLLLSLTAVAAQAANSPAPAGAAKAAAPATQPAFREGVNYAPVVPAQPVTTPPGQVEVIEFFWYGCPHCFQLETYLEDWLKHKPANVAFRRVPAIIRPDWEPAARAYYVAQELNLGDQADEAIFNEIHLANDPLLTEADFERFFVKQFKLTPKQFEAAWSSPATDASIVQARVLAGRYSVNNMGVIANINMLGVPMLAVNGRWLTGGGYGVGYPQIMQVVNFLIQQEQAAMPARAQ